MNYTKNYHLPQWVKEDRIMMDDFNRMCADMEAGLTKNARDAAAATSSAAATAAAASSAAMTAAQKAQTTADKAVDDAAQAQATADAAYCPSQKPYAVGTYTGTDAALPITLGFQPQFVIISCADSCYANEYTFMARNGIKSERLEFTSTGFTVKKNYVVNSGQQIPYPNTKGKQYIYIAFR